MLKQWFFEKKKTFWTVLLLLQCGILCLVALAVFANAGNNEILSPALSSWESRYTAFAGSWQGTPEIYASGAESEGEVLDLIYGPYLSLPAGSYAVNVAYSAENEQSFAAHSFRHAGSLFRHEEEVLPAGEGVVTCHFTLLKSVDDLEVRICYNGEGSLNVTGISISKSSFLLREVFFSLAVIFILLDISLLVIADYRVKDGRELWIDACRGLGILLVLLSHTRPSFMWFLFGFHIPLFFILSGYLYKDRPDPGAYVKKLFRAYLLPYFFFGLVNLVIFLVRMEVAEHVSRQTALHYLGQVLYTGEELPNCAPLWFLPALFFAMIAQQFLHKLKSPALHVFLVSLSFTGAILIDKFDPPMLPWSLSQAMMGLVFAEFGFLIRHFDLIGRMMRIRWYDALGLMFMLAFGGSMAVILQYESSGINVSIHAMTYGRFGLMLVGAICLSVFCMALCAYACRAIKKGMLPLVALGQHTLIYFALDFCIEDLASFLLLQFLGTNPWQFLWGLKVILLTATLFVCRKIRLDRVIEL